MGFLSKIVGTLSGSKGYKQGARNIKFQPFNIRSGLGSTTFEGTQGTFALAPEYQSIRDQLLGGAGGFLGKGMTFDPNVAAEEAYGLLSRIRAPQRGRDVAGLRDTLFSQGRLGAADAEGANPELAAYYRALAEQDTQDAYSSIGLGQSLLDSMLSRGSGLFSQAMGLDTASTDMFRTGLYAGQGGLDASKAQAEMLAKAGEKESSFWQSLLAPVAGAVGGWAGGKVGGWLS